ncbi:MAG TPA: hypothetical protein VHW67_03840 [Solirubrobacteraceae bacterium]|nr:hypothetical protein [Solirubrobacteraceae bacterium]
MSTLLFTAEDGLRERQRDSAEPRERSGMLTPVRTIELDDGATRFLAAGEQHEIVPLGGSGWAFELRDRNGDCSGGYQPFRLRRGGRLRVQGAGLALHGQPWSHEEWQFSTYDGRRLAATLPTRPDERAATGAAAGANVALELQAIEASSELLDTLALGCWLISRWRSLPTVDHLLCSSASAGAIATQRGRTPARSGATAGIRPQAAN